MSQFLGELVPLLYPTWKWLMAPVVVLGVAPGFCARIISLMYPPGDPRRPEVVGELRAVPYRERPLWLGQQLEIAICEGLPDRLRYMAEEWAASHWKLTDGEHMNYQHPDSFLIPDRREREALRLGDTVKLGFTTRDGWGERMWVEVTGHRRGRYTGRLVNQPVGLPRLDYGDKVRFRPEHVIGVVELVDEDVVAEAGSGDSTAAAATDA